MSTPATPLTQRQVEILEAIRHVRLTFDTYARLLAQNIQIRFEPKPPIHTIAGQIYVPAFDSS